METAIAEGSTMVRIGFAVRLEQPRFKEYSLRVDPQCRPLLQDGTKGEPQDMTARNAVASTFGMRGEQWGPEAQT